MKAGLVKLSVYLSIILCIIGLTNCSSEGFGSVPHNGMTPSIRSVYIVPNTDERAAEYMPEIATALRKAGYTISSDNTAPYKVKVIFAGGGFDLSCAIIMTDHDIAVASGKGVNPGWGVWLARDRAYQGVFRRALNQFSRRI